MNRDVAQREFQETTRLLLEAMQAQERMIDLPPEATLEEAEHVRREAERLSQGAMQRFKTMCGRLAIHAKEGLSG